LEAPVRNWLNWMLLIGGCISILAELILGAATGFDLALLGGAIGTGGLLGLLLRSNAVGLFSAGALALIYLAFLRRAVRRHLTPADKPSNIDALVGRTGTVMVRIAPHSAGQAKFGDEIWRVELLRADDSPREVGQTVTVASVEGVTLKVR
jgi:membrane protein implicated in regulation of membrane protease activity